MAKLTVLQLQTLRLVVDHANIDLDAFIAPGWEIKRALESLERRGFVRRVEAWALTPAGVDALEKESR